MEQTNREKNVRQKLSELIVQDRSLAENLTRCRGLLNDLCRDSRREINLVTHALSVGVVAQLCGNSVPKMSPIALKMLYSRLVAHLQNDHGWSHDAACWAIESWVLALGLHSSESESVPVPIPMPMNKQTSPLVPPPPLPLPSASSSSRKTGVVGTQRIQNRSSTSRVPPPLPPFSPSLLGSSNEIETERPFKIFREAVQPLDLTGNWEGQLAYVGNSDTLAQPWQLFVNLTQSDFELKGIANNFGMIVGKLNESDIFLDTQISEGAWSSKHVVFIGKVMTSEDPNELFIEGTFEGNKFDRGVRMKLSGRFVLMRIF